MAPRSPESDALVSAAKAYVDDYGAELIQDCIQIHGGIGLTFEHDLHLYLRRHTINRALYGTAGRAPATASPASWSRGADSA